MESTTWKKIQFNDSIKFQFQVRYLKIIEKSGYQALPWVRYITQNGGKYMLFKSLLIMSDERIV